MLTFFSRYSWCGCRYFFPHFVSKVKNEYRSIVFSYYDLCTILFRRFFYIKIYYVRGLKKEGSGLFVNKTVLCSAHILCFSFSFTITFAFIICWSYSKFGPKNILRISFFLIFYFVVFFKQKKDHQVFFSKKTSSCFPSKNKKLEKMVQFFVLPLREALALIGFIFTRKRAVISLSTPEVFFTLFFSTFMLVQSTRLSPFG